MQAARTTSARPDKARRSGGGPAACASACTRADPPAPAAARDAGLRTAHGSPSRRLRARPPAPRPSPDPAHAREDWTRREYWRPAQAVPQMAAPLFVPNSVAGAAAGKDAEERGHEDQPAAPDDGVHEAGQQRREGDDGEFGHAGVEARETTWRSVVDQPRLARHGEFAAQSKRAPGIPALSLRLQQTGGSAQRALSRRPAALRRRSICLSPRTPRDGVPVARARNVGTHRIAPHRGFHEHLGAKATTALASAIAGSCPVAAVKRGRRAGASKPAPRPSWGHTS